MSVFDLKGRTALVTGGGSGMGFGIATAYAEAGANVVIADLNPEFAEASAKKLVDAGHRAIGVGCDVTDTAAFQAALDAGVKAFGGVDILCNNAGYVIIEDVFEATPQNWDKVFAVNTKAVFFCSQAFAAHLKKQGKGGNIVIISSNAAKNTFNGQASYNASKAAVANMAQSLSKEFAAFGINVNAVCPGGTDTEMLRYCMEDAVKKSGDPNLSVDDLRVAWAAPGIGRLVQPVEVGRVVVFLSGEAAHIIRGQAITIDAGATPY